MGPATALVMAGGRSERMRATLGPRHKTLVPILAVPMMERNLCALLSERFDDIAVSYSSREMEIEEYLEKRATGLLRSRGASLTVIREEHPLGTIGAAGRLENRSGPVLVVNSDNLTTLALRSFVEHHIKAEAVLTIAVHHEDFRIPFGAVTVREGEIVDYVEKPTLPVAISSGAYVLSPESRTMIPEGRRFDLPELFFRLLRSKRKVAAFEHNAAWIDVNDATAVRQAERLILDHYDEFELWKQPPEAEVTETFLYEGRRVSRFNDGISTGQAGRFLRAFDELLGAEGMLIRHRVCVLPVETLHIHEENRVWFSIDDGNWATDVTTQRCLAVIRQWL